MCKISIEMGNMRKIRSVSKAKFTGDIEWSGLVTEEEEEALDT